MTVLLGLPRRRGSVGPVELPAGRLEHPGLVDSFGRVATDLRVSLTDRCNLRCSYCMPEEGLEWMSSDRVLTDAELVRLITIAVEHLGVREVRFTGGEPLLRKGLERIVAATTALRTADGTSPDTSLTTNALGLARRAGGLVEAGLARINVSLDTLDPARFATITHRDRHADVLTGLRAATAAGLGPIKINAVLLRGVNDDEAGRMLRWSLREGYELRFIEQMPLDPHGAWDAEAMIDADEVLQRLTDDFAPGELRLVEQGVDARGSAPAELWQVTWRDGQPGAHAVERTGTVGIIGSVTRPFCAACDRTRLTADGAVRDCLFSTGETDLRAQLRAGATDAELADAWRVAMWGKQAGHGTGGTAGESSPVPGPAFAVPSRSMSAVGG